MQSLEPPQLKLNFDDFGIPAEELQGREVLINWENWITRIDRGRDELARQRFLKVSRAIDGEFNFSHATAV
jgi:hypothetical protein